MRHYRVAAIQLDSQNDKQKNLAAVEHYIDLSAAGGAQLVSLPEDMNLVGRNIGDGGNAEPIPGPTSELLVRKAKEHRIYLHGGSFRSIIPGDTRYYNTTLMIAPDGSILGEYHKAHTFDAHFPDGTVSQESAKIRPGSEIVTIDTELGRLGLAICYDLRFPELFRLLAMDGAQILLTPSDFTHFSGLGVWEVLVRARAIENGCYVIAADQCGRKPAYPAHGHSMIVDPWGRILAEAGDEPGVIFADIDLDYLDECRAQVPSLQNRRADLYRLERNN